MTPNEFMSKWCAGWHPAMPATVRADLDALLAAQREAVAQDVTSRAEHEDRCARTAKNAHVRMKSGIAAEVLHEVAAAIRASADEENKRDDTTAFDGGRLG